MIAIGTILENKKMHSVYGDDHKLVRKVSSSLLQSLTQYRFDITHVTEEEESIIVGTGTIYSSSAIIFERVKDGFILILISAFFKTLALWIIIYYFIFR